MDVYHRLLAHYGPQHWWPAKGPFEVIVGAILTQSAAWGNVEKAVANLSEAKALTPPALRQLSINKLAELVHPCGYYNAKAFKLKSFALWLGNHYGDIVPGDFIWHYAYRSHIRGVAKLYSRNHLLAGIY